MTTTFPTPATQAPSPKLNCAANPGSPHEDPFLAHTALFVHPTTDAAAIDGMTELFSLFEDGDPDLSSLEFTAAAAAAASAPVNYKAKADSAGLSTSPVPTPSLAVPTINPLKRRSAVAALSPRPDGAEPATPTSSALKLQRAAYAAAPVATKHPARDGKQLATAPMTEPPMAPRGKEAAAAAAAADADEAAALRYACYDGPRTAKRAAILKKWKRVRAERISPSNMGAQRCPAKAEAAKRKQRDNGRFGLCKLMMHAS